MGLAELFLLGKGCLQPTSDQELLSRPALSNESLVQWSSSVQGLHVRGRRTSHGSLQGVVLGSIHEVCVLLLEGRSPGCVQKVDFSFGQLRTLSRNSLPHKWMRNYWHSISGEVGKDSVAGKGDCCHGLGGGSCAGTRVKNCRGVTWQQMMKSGGFSKNDKVPHQRLLEI